MRSGSRSGIVLALVLAIILVLGVTAGGTYMLSRQSYRNLGKIDGFLRATSIAEACHMRVVARLEQEGWADRWFRKSPQMGSDTWEDGQYTFAIANARTESDLQADLLVRASVGGSSVVALWRLWADPYTLSPYRKIRTAFFSYLDPQTRVDTSALGPISDQVDADLTTRANNRPFAENTGRTIQTNPKPEAIPPALGIPNPGPVLTDIPPVIPGQPPTPISTRAGPPEPSLPVMPSMPPPDPGAGATMEQIAGAVNRLRRLRDARSKAEQAKGDLEAALSSLGALEQKMAACCGANPGPDCPTSGLCECQVAAAKEKLNAGNGQLATSVQTCLNDIDKASQALEDNAGPPEPSGSSLEQLNSDADSAAGCADQVSEQVKTAISAAKSALGPACTAGGF